MIPRTRKLWPFLAAAGSLGVGCNAIIDSNGYYELASSDAGPQTMAEGGKDDACAPGVDRSTLESACTGSTCVPFGISVPSCNGSLCPLPTPAPAEAGAPPPSSDAGSGDAAAPEAGPPSCSQAASDPNAIVYVTGSTALASFIGEVSSALASEVTVVYQQSGSCVGVRSAIDPANNVLSSANGAATYYSNGVQHPCTIDAGEQIVADIGASDVFYTTCYLGQPVTPPLPASVGENLGPVQIMNFAVPQSSSQKSISLAAAYYVFGFGGSQYPVPPWTDPMQLQIRSANSGTQSMIAAAIGVPSTQWYGVGHGTSAQVGAALVAAGQSGNPATVDAAMGILASDYLLQNTQTLRGLAVQDRNASCSYYPSSTGFARDDINARDGHYPLWGPSHFYARIDPSTNLPLKAGVTKFIDGLNGLTALPGLDLVAEYASKGLVPECAMHVGRANDGGDYTPFRAPVTCNCYFDLHATGSNLCQTCNANSDCPHSAPNCNKFGPAPQQGYCDL
jgi:ABC-type phosphate transport system substrate-binding protein